MSILIITMLFLSLTLNGVELCPTGLYVNVDHTVYPLYSIIENDYLQIDSN